MYSRLQYNVSLRMCVCVFSGVVAFFFLTRKIPVIQEEVPNLNYYWVPLLVRVANTHTYSIFLRTTLFLEAC